MIMKMSMKVPKNRQTRAADDVWMASEAVARWFGMTTARDGLEMAVRDYVAQLAKTDTTFAQIWEEVKAEGIEPKT